MYDLRQEYYVGKPNILFDNLEEAKEDFPSLKLPIALLQIFCKVVLPAWEKRYYREVEYLIILYLSLGMDPLWRKIA